MTLKSGILTVLVAAVVSALVTVGSLAYLVRHAGGAAMVATAVDEAKITKTVHDYLTKNPEILVDMSNELDKRQQAAQAAQQTKAIGENADKIYHSQLGGVVGNPDGDVSVVEFFDYNCGYCRHAMPEVVKMVNDDKKVRLVLKEFPIFGDDSEAAAKVALASIKQGKYFEMHQKLFAEPGKADLDKALKVAQELGLDIDQLKKDMEDPSVKAALDENKALADKLGIQGTPYYLVGDHVIAGAPDDLAKQLTDNISGIRQNGCKTTC